MVNQLSQAQSRSTSRSAGPYQTLYEHEIAWRDRQPLLQSKGYMLRPRLRPGWTPSWTSTGTYWRRAEDSVPLPLRPFLVDATRISDGKLVYIKQVETNNQESRIALMLSSSQDPANHSVPILDIFVDTQDDSISYMVMPFLRPVDNPPFYAIEEILDFVDQILECLVFIHSKGVAHRDCSAENILMDAANMYPYGFHPIRSRHLQDVSTSATIIPRTMVEVKYYFVDYGVSSYFPPGSQARLVVGTDGRDQGVPELSEDVPYDPFKVDIFTIGNVLRQLFCDIYSNCDFFLPLVKSMIQNDPGDRPSAEKALQHWREIKCHVKLLHRHWRPRERGESLIDFISYDIYHILSYTGHTLLAFGRRLCHFFT